MTLADNSAQKSKSDFSGMMRMHSPRLLERSRLAGSEPLPLRSIKHGRFRFGIETIENNSNMHVLSTVLQEKERCNVLIIGRWGWKYAVSCGEKTSSPKVA